MDRSTLDALLYKNESETLDFKQVPYPFKKETEEQKAKMLKDILGFANAWRDAPAHILLGVQEADGKAKVVGCRTGTHIDDSDLRQFVNSKTNRPIALRYEKVEYDDKVVGVITIDRQERPFYLQKKCAFLQKGAVYVRTGSNTDPNNPAMPDEISDMVKHDTTPRVDVEVGFSSGQDDNSPLTSKWEIEAKGQILCPPLRKELKDAGSASREERPNMLSLPVAFRERVIPRGVLNKGYYGAVADWVALNSGYIPLPIEIRNAGGVPLTQVRLQLSATLDSIRVAMLASERKLDRPRERIERVVNIPQTLWGNDLQSLTWEDPLLEFTDTFRNIQPGRTIPVTPFGIVIRDSLAFDIQYTVFANELQSSVTGTLNVNVQTPMGIKEWGVKEFVAVVDKLDGKPLAKILP